MKLLNSISSFGFGVVASMMLTSCASVEAPAPVGPLPSEHQVEWHKMEKYAFVHFGLNTFADREWGYGETPASELNPTNLDCEQWVRVAKEAGMQGFIITAKHHDGFCLWPTELTEYCIRNSPYKDGKGDIVGELQAACKKHGLKFGVYLSPWDRNAANYGTPEYLEYYHKQIEELTTRYGEIFEFWLDGANGGDGYYGGANETRTIDRRTYYNFPEVFAHILKNQPQAIIFSDGGPGCRWVGNENGIASATSWALLRGDEVYPGYPEYRTLQYGHTDGTHWIPAECDVSIRPGWFFHESENDKVKSVEKLIDLYYRSVGHNANFLLNFPVDRTGRIHPTDSANAVDAHKRVMAELADNILAGIEPEVSNTRGGKFGAKAITDDDYDTYWATDDNVTEASVTFTLPAVTKVNRMMLQEYIPLGQRVQEFLVEYRSGDEWMPITINEETTTIGYKRLLRFATVETNGLRVTIKSSRACPCINNIAAYYGGAESEIVFEDRADDFPSIEFTSTAEPDRFVLDLGDERTVNVLHYKPNTDGKGTITHYELYAGPSANNVQLITKGEFSNIKNNPIAQSVRFAPTKARVLVLKATRMVNEGDSVAAQRLGVEQF